MSADADARLAALERAVEALRDEVAALRAATAAPTAPAPVPAPPPAPPAVTYGALTRPPAGGRASATAPSPSRRAAGLGAAAHNLVAGLGFPADHLSVETLVGRYGAVAVGALVLLMGVGAFLTWAVENFTLLPAARVVLGAAAAAALAVLGERLRRRAGAERFGEVLLALALAVVHVDAWAAGPYLHLVSAEAALGAAAAASAALTALAWRARQQSLFAVGVGGALLAPFVSGAGDAHPLVRPIYGWLVLTAGLAAFVQGSDARRPWRSTLPLLALGAAVYATAQLDAATRALGDAAGYAGVDLARLADRDVPAAFALACAAGPLAVLWWRARRPVGGTPAVGATEADALLVRLAIAQLTTALLVLWAAAAATPGSSPGLVLCAFATLVGAQAVAALPAVALPGTGPGGRPSPATVVAPTIGLAALVLPFATLLAALAAYRHGATPAAAGVAALWSVISAAGAAVAWRHSAPAAPDPRLGAHLAAAGLAGAFALVRWSAEHDALRVALLGGAAILTAATFARAPGRAGGRDRRPLLALAPPFATLAGATLWGGSLLHARPAFAYTPFLTAPSAAAAVVALGWSACAAVVWRAGNDRIPRTERATVVGVAAAVALLWGRAELARAVAPDVATFLLVGYFATAGVAGVALGRARQIAAARQAGLALALFAALKAIVEASQLDAVALRVGSYLLVGGFLLGVGYWYRAGSQDAGAVREAV